MRTTFPVSCPNIYVRFFVRGAGHFAGWPSQENHQILRLPTNWCSNYFQTIEFFGDGLTWPENESSFKDFRRAFAGGDTGNGHSSAWPSTSWSRGVKLRPQ